MLFLTSRISLYWRPQVIQKVIRQRLSSWAWSISQASLSDSCTHDLTTVFHYIYKHWYWINNWIVFFQLPVYSICSSTQYQIRSGVHTWSHILARYVLLRHLISTVAHYFERLFRGGIYWHSRRARRRLSKNQSIPYFTSFVLLDHICYSVCTLQNLS